MLCITLKVLNEDVWLFSGYDVLFKFGITSMLQWQHSEVHVTWNIPPVGYSWATSAVWFKSSQLHGTRRAGKGRKTLNKTTVLLWDQDKSEWKHPWDRVSQDSRPGAMRLFTVNWYHVYLVTSFVQHVSIATFTTSTADSEEVGILKEIAGYPKGTKNVYTKFPGNPPKYCWVVSIWTKMVDRLTVQHQWSNAANGESNVKKQFWNR